MNNEFNFQSNVPNPYDGFDSAQPQKKKNNYALVSMILGIVAVAGCCICCCSEVFGLLLMGVCAILAIVFAFLSKKNNNGKMDGKAIAGLVLGIVALVILLLFLATIIGTVSMFGSMTEEEFIAFFDENLKPMVDEETYNEFINAFKEGYAAGYGE